VLLGSQAAFQQSLWQRQRACKGNTANDPALCPAGDCPTLSLRDQSPSPKTEGKQPVGSGKALSSTPPGLVAQD